MYWLLGKVKLNMLRRGRYPLLFDMCLLADLAAWAANDGKRIRVLWRQQFVL